MRGEQKIYRDAKISGGITHFAASSSPVQIRRMNRSLYWKKKVSEVTEIIEQEYNNPFGIHVNKVNISSGVVLDNDIG